jgi:AraC family transcriptional regulator, exoenzyme S synthesis regulatory protein ExsA
MPQQHRRIEHAGVTMIESCHYLEQMQGSTLTTEFELIHLLSGKLVFKQGNHNGVLEAGETGIVHRGTFFDFVKQKTASGANYASVLFFLKNDFLNEFLATYPLKNLPNPTNNHLTFAKIGANPLISNFINSLLPYFDSPLQNNPNLLKIKTFEILITLTETHPKIFNQLITQNHSPKKDLLQVLEQYFTKNLSLEDFARLSGRSLATFKRDFEKTFKQSPARWLKEKLLQLAHQLLSHTTKQVSEIALEVGFEDYSHFTRAFKAQYGILPKEVKNLKKTAANI